MPPFDGNLHPPDAAVPHFHMTPQAAQPVQPSAPARVEPHPPLAPGTGSRPRGAERNALAPRDYVCTAAPQDTLSHIEPHTHTHTRKECWHSRLPPPQQPRVSWQSLARPGPGSGGGVDVGVGGGGGVLLVCGGRAWLTPCSCQTHPMSHAALPKACASKNLPLQPKERGKCVRVATLTPATRCHSLEALREAIEPHVLCLVPDGRRGTSWGRGIYHYPTLVTASGGNTCTSRAWCCVHVTVRVSSKCPPQRVLPKAHEFGEHRPLVGHSDVIELAARRGCGRSPNGIAAHGVSHPRPTRVRGIGTIPLSLQLQAALAALFLLPALRAFRPGPQVRDAAVVALPMPPGRRRCLRRGGTCNPCRQAVWDGRQRTVRHAPRHVSLLQRVSTHGVAGTAGTPSESRLQQRH